MKTFGREGGREFSAEKLNLPYSSERVWDVSPLTAPRGTDMMFRTAPHSPKHPPGLSARLHRAPLPGGGKQPEPPRTNTPRGRERERNPLRVAEDVRREAMSCSEGSKAINAESRPATFPAMDLMNNFGDSYGFR